jgi:hypothetical protein
MINSLINKFVPFRLLPKRTRVIRYLEITFEKSTGENLKNTFKENGYTASQIEQVFDSAFKQYGDKIDALMMSNDQIALERESLPAMAFILDKALIVKPRDFQLEQRLEAHLEQHRQPHVHEKDEVDRGEAQPSPPSDNNNSSSDEWSSMGADHGSAGNIPKGEENVEDASARWLRGEWEYLQRKRAKGRQLDDYEMGLEKQYEELLKKNC